MKRSQNGLHGYDISRYTESVIDIQYEISFRQAQVKIMMARRSAINNVRAKLQISRQSFKPKSSS